MDNLTATVTSDRERSWYEPTYRTYRDENGEFKSVQTGTRRKTPGHGGRDVPTGKSVVYVHVKNESLWDDFANRTSRPHTAWKPFVERALREHGFEFSKLTWSQKAGCSCPCSPGFIVSTGTRGHDLWVTIEADEPQRTDDAEATHRAQQLAANLMISVPEES